MPAFKEALEQQMIVDEEANAEALSAAENYDPTGMGLYVSPEHSKAVGKDIGLGTFETAKAIPTAPFRAIRGGIRTMENVLRALPGSEQALDWAEGKVPQWFRDFSTSIQHYNGKAADYGADPETITGNLGKFGADIAVNLWALKAAGLLSKGGGTVKGAGLAQSIIPVLRNAGHVGAISFILAGDDKAFAKETRDLWVKFLGVNPHLQELFIQTMTSENPAQDKLLQQTWDGLQNGALTAGMEWIFPAMRSFRRFVGRQMAVEEAEQAFKIKPGSWKRYREIQQKWEGAEPTVIQDVGKLEETFIGKPMPSGGGPSDIAVGSKPIRDIGQGFRLWEEPTTEGGRTYSIRKSGTVAARGATPGEAVAKFHGPDQPYFEKIAAEHARSGGSSISAEGVNLSEEGKGFAASFVGFEKRIPGPVTVQALREYSMNPGVARRLRDNPGSFIGTWFDEGTKENVIDISRRFASESEARAFATSNKQKAIWDFSGKKEIRLDEPVSASAGASLGAGNKGWVAPDGQVHFATGSSHSSTAASLAKRYGFTSESPEREALQKGFIRWDRTGEHMEFRMEVLNDPEVIERAKKLIEANPAKTYYVDLSSAEAGKREYFLAKSQEEALLYLDRAARGEEIKPRRSRMAQYLEETGPPGGPSPSIIHDLTKAAEEAKGRLRLKINRPQMFAGLTDPQDVKDIATIGAALLARGVTKSGAWKKEMLALAGQRAIEAKLNPEQTETFLGRVARDLDIHRTRSEQHLERYVTDLAPQFKEKMGRLSELFEKGADRWDWYEDAAKSLERLGPKEDQKMVIAFTAALSPRNRVITNVEQALTLFHRFRMKPPESEGDWFKLAEGLGMTEKQDTVKRLQQAVEGVRLNKEGVLDDLFPMAHKESQKVNAFYRNLWHQIERPDDVTIDSWMFHVFGIEKRAKAHTYSVLREVIRQEAAKRGMQPRQLQAALWTGAHRDVAETIERTGKPYVYKVLGEEKQFTKGHSTMAKEDRPIREIFKETIDDMVSKGLLSEGEGGRLVPTKPKPKTPSLKDVVDKLLKKQQARQNPPEGA